MHNPLNRFALILALVAGGCGKYEPAGPASGGRPGPSPVAVPSSTPSATATPDQVSARRTTANHLKQIALAFHNHHTAYRSFPPAVLLGPDGKTPHSWRVALLPFLEQKGLYDQYRLNEPWDSPANRQVLARMPNVYRAPLDRVGSTNAGYFVLAGPGTIFDGPKGRAFLDIMDGTSNTILLVESKREIPWTQPEDIPYDPQKPLPDFGGYYDGEFGIALADGAYRFVRKNLDEKTFRALITRGGGEIVGDF